jgi:hypothetical protein
MKSYTLFLFYNLLLLAAGFFLHQFAPQIHEAADANGVPYIFKTAATFTDELSVAFVIAAILSFGVEWLTRVRHHALEKATIEKINSELSQDVLTWVFKQNLPANVVDQVRSRLFQAQVCRLLWTTDYVLKLASDTVDPKGKFITWTCTDTYELKNMERRKVDHIIRMEAELIEYPECWDITLLEIDGKPEEINVDKSGGRLKFAHSIRLKAGQTVSIKTIQTGAGPAFGHEVICSVLAVETLVLKCEHPPEISVVAAALHPDEAIPKSGLGPGKKEWTLGAVFPGQGMELVWRLQTPEAPKMLIDKENKV